MTVCRTTRERVLLTKHSVTLCWSSNTAIGIGANADIDPVVCSHGSSAPTATSPWRLVPISARIPSGLEVDGFGRLFSGQKGAQLRFPNDERPTLDNVHYGRGCGGCGWIELQIGLVAQGRLEAFEVLSQVGVSDVFPRRNLDLVRPSRPWRMPAICDSVRSKTRDPLAIPGLTTRRKGFKKDLPEHP